MSAHLDDITLTNYWLGELEPTAEEPVELHLLDCDECSGRLRAAIALASGLRQLARAGVVRVVIGESLLNRLAAQGFRIRQYAPPAGGKVACTVTAQDDFLIGRLAVDLTGIRQLDLAFCDETGVEQERLRDIPFHPSGSEVILNYPIDYARRMPANVMRMRLVAVEAPVERQIAEYTFDHTPS